MQKFKQRWEIQKNWQLIFPIVGILVILYSSYKLSALFFNEANIYIKLLITLLITLLLLKFILFLFKKLKNKWVLTYKWEMIRVFMVFAITGSASIFVGRPVIKFLGITKDNLSPAIYWVLYIFIGLIFYQILLVFIGWVFGQFNFFWNFEKKMIRRLGLKRFLNE